jgi:hypothetical protein
MERRPFVTDRDLKALERRTFRTANDDGLWDVLIASVIAMFAIAPLLSDRLGDFWSSAIFLPVWIVTYLTIQVIRARIVIPRIGTVSPTPQRTRRMCRFGLVMVIVNTAALVAGLAIAAAAATDRLDFDGIGYPIALSVVSLVGFSLAAYVTSIVRFALYGLMLAVAPLIGEWLWRNDLAAHHGYPVAFGTVAAIIFVVGIVRFATLTRSHPVPPNTALV